jgi:hypothetical protein
MSNFIELKEEYNTLSIKESEIKVKLYNELNDLIYNLHDNGNLFDISINTFISFNSDYVYISMIKVEEDKSITIFCDSERTEDEYDFIMNINDFDYTNHIIELIDDLLVEYNKLNN